MLILHVIFNEIKKKQCLSTFYLEKQLYLDEKANFNLKQILNEAINYFKKLISKSKIELRKQYNNIKSIRYKRL